MADEVTGSTWTDSVNVPGAERVAPIRDFARGPANGSPGTAATVTWLHADQVGTTRVLTDQNGNNLVQCNQNSYYAQDSLLTYAPFGGELDCTQARTDYKFTGKPRDQESGLDYFGARYNASTLGRFLSPDPLQVNALRLINPQRWNEYAYAIDSPETFTDPDGLDVIAVNFVREVPFGGHEGIMVVDKQGNARYARFGPKGGGAMTGKGEADVYPLRTRVQLDGNGLPTADTYRSLASEVAQLEGQSASTVGFEYFKTSDADTAALESWMTNMDQLSKAGHLPDYQFNGANCPLFCIAGLQTANVINPKARLSIVPNRLWEILPNLSDGDWENNQLHEHVRHTIRYCGSTPSLPR